MFKICSLLLATIPFAQTLLANETRDLPPFQPPQLKPSQMDFGGVGLMQMPTGRMAEEGEFSFNYTQNSEYEFYSFSLQLMPWFESTIRYTEVQDLLYSDDEEFSGDTKLADKGIDAKLRLLKEGNILPEVSVGVRDIGGTGLFDGEFIAATKRFASENYGQLDVTLGLGWGYLGQSGNLTNPLCSYRESFCNRDTSSDNGGTIDYERWFHGNSAIYGGLEYQTPYSPLRLKLEYDGNDYSQDAPVTRGQINMEQDSPWNFGLVYGLNKFTDLRLSYERGNTVTLGFSLFTNIDKNTQLFKHKSIKGNEQVLENIRNIELDTTTPTENWSKVNKQLAQYSGYIKNQYYLSDKELTLVTEQKNYRDRDIAQDKVAEVLSTTLPRHVESYKIIETVKGLPVKTTEISRNAYEDYLHVNYINPSIEDATEELTIENIPTEDSYYSDKQKFYYALSPSLTQTVGSAEDFYLYSIGTRLDTSYWLSNSWQLESSLYLNLHDNYYKFNYTVREDGTSNPRVRTLAREYIHDNRFYIKNLQLSNFQKLTDNLYQQTYLGHLESMFAGIGSELLYRKQNANWALGLDWNLVSQRNPDTWLETYNDPWAYSDTDEVLDIGTTGHASIYYRPNWGFLQNTLFRLDYGKFLAQDVGFQLDFSKQFNSGMIVGAYASKTDMSAEEFGEGSFTKGFYFSIPYDLMTVKPSTNRANFNWQPLTRDGGQKLKKLNQLYEITDPLNPWYERPVFD